MCCIFCFGVLRGKNKKESGQLSFLFSVLRKWLIKKPAHQHIK